MSKVAARWELVKRAVEIRNEMKSETLIFGNGDALDLSDAREKVRETGCDGVMLGRAIFGNPWLFNEGYAPSLEERLETLAEHIHLFDTILGHQKSFAIMKKHFKSYVHGFEGAVELRGLLMSAETAAEAVKIIQDNLPHLKSVVV